MENNNITGNEPAMPEPITAGGYRGNGNTGLTIRQQFAMAAMQGILANDVSVKLNSWDVAIIAVKNADKLIAELNI